jgi:hypothetical protein
LAGRCGSLKTPSKSSSMTAPSLPAPTTKTDGSRCSIAYPTGFRSSLHPTTHRCYVRGAPEYEVLVVLKKTRILRVCSWFQTPIKDEKHGCL